MDPPEDKAPTIRKFNPGTFQTDEEIIRQFVVREPELNIVLDVLRDNVDSRSCQHILVVAPRGRGKTMLLARVAAELRAENDLSQSMLPVRFMEESQEVLDIADFWLETLFHLSREIAGRDPDLARELRAVHEGPGNPLARRFPGGTGQGHGAGSLRPAGQEAPCSWSRTCRRYVPTWTRISGWQLRETLQTEPQIILLGTATSRFERLDDVREPFLRIVPDA